MLNAFTPNQQLSSCVLSTLADDTHNIVDTGKNLAIYSKFKGGTSLNITEMRAKGSYIEGTQGISSGPIPFMQFYGKIMKAWNQGGKRPGALAIYFSWWHLDVTDILSLPSNGGTDENRERGLKYALKVNRIFAKAVLNNEDIYLFDPKDVPDLIGKFGKEFEKKYFEYVDKTSIRKKKINARELIEKVFKERTETGKVYLFHEENVNEATLLNRYIGSSNLCCEIILPSRASETITEELLTLENGTKKIVKTTTAGEIALCNLASVNLEKWFYLSDEERWNIIRLCVRALDNTVDLAFYPVKEAKNSNLMYRYLGIGVLNYTNYLALNKIVIDTKEALEETDSLFDDWSYKIITVSMELSMEKGKFEKFYETEWADGILPIHKANKKAINLTNYIPDMKKWDELASKVKIYGLRNAQLMAIAPTATSGKAINSIESIEPIANLFYKEEGTITIPTLVPNFRKNNRYYKKNFDCDQYSLIDNGAIRQKYLDQSQSLNIYIKRPDSLMELINIHFYGFDLGLKTFYYIKQIKEDGQEIEEEICESCS
jgi:ribonucleoside-diphosphate reductase alpha chain